MKAAWTLHLGVSVEFKCDGLFCGVSGCQSIETHDSLRIISMLCQRCITATSNILSIFSRTGCAGQSEGGPSYDLEHGNLSGLISSANDGCALCQLILGVKKLQDIIAGAKESTLKDSQVIIWVHALNVGMFDVKITSFIGLPGMRTRENWLGPFELYCLAPLPVGIDTGSSSLTKCIRAKLNNKPDSPEAFSLARAWIHDCMRNHRVCTRPSKAILPPRLIDVGLQCGSPEPRLVECIRSRQIEGHYVTLSHCWGTDTHFVLTTANVELCKEKLPIELLPATFRDTITATRNLGFQFLWIDSLCILQDSPADWQANCSLMSTIYENSVVTIGALWAEDSNGGLFADRETICLRNEYGPTSIADTSDNKELCSIGIRYAPDSFDHAVYESKLHGRAWVLQERLLSPAILYYWNSEIYWECCTSFAAGSRPDPVMHNFGYLKHMPNEMYFNLSLGPGGYYTAWYTIVENYTRRNLTFRSDRLPAILGLATRFSSFPGSTHLAGLWFDDLHRGLIWRSCGSGITREKHASEGAVLELACSELSSEISIGRASSSPTFTVRC
jgi:hypothetical protein